MVRFQYQQPRRFMTASTRGIVIVREKHRPCVGSIPKNRTFSRLCKRPWSCLWMNRRTITCFGAMSPPNGGGFVSPRPWRRRITASQPKDKALSFEKSIYPWRFGLCFRRGVWSLLGIFSLRQTGHVASSYFHSNLFRDLQC
jgi:hypothetical protein